MNYEERLRNVAVLGAAGKMGSGIALLTAMEMADIMLQKQSADEEFVLHAVDISHKALSGLISYLRAQVKRAAEKKTVWLRSVYKDREDLVENEEIINQYIEDVLSIIRPVVNLEAAFQSTLVFEAVAENVDLKVKLLSTIFKNNDNDVWFFTNTSSIPISELDEKAGLNGRIIGFHFYNPPAVQKLVELIRGKTTRGELADFALEYAKKLRKTVVPSNDIAGFIGNGHFMRDLLFGISEAERLTGEGFTFPQAVYTVNKVSQEYLVRPMGIFQLIDYVGVDVCQCILDVMNARLDETLHSDVIDRYVAAGVKGGQFPNGSQKDGFLQYVKGKPAGVYDPDAGKYVPMAELAAVCDEKLGTPPVAPPAWKSMLRHPDKDSVFTGFFGGLKSSDTLGAELARRYGSRSKEIGLKLVSDGVAESSEDVNKVLLTGFFHVYGPINNYFD